MELYNDYNLIRMLIPSNNCYLDKNTNCIVFKKWNLKKKLNLISSKLNKFLFSLESVFFCKIKFKGKGFRVRFKKKSKILKFTFGHSHINYIFINSVKIKIKRLGKYKYTISSKTNTEINKISKKIRNIRPINTYTKRGIRIGRQILYKRKGKKSTYF